METELDLRIEADSRQIDVIRSLTGTLFSLPLAKPPSHSVLIKPTRKIDTQSTEQAIVEFVSDLDSVLPLLSAVTKTLRVAIYIEAGEAAAFGIELSKATLSALSVRALDLDVMFFPCE